MLEAIEIIDKYDYLQSGFKYIVENSASNNAPYHNLNHLLTVTKYVYNGLEVEGITDEEEVKNILIAALFHDVDHSGGKKTDDENIKKAKSTIKKFGKSEGIDLDMDIINEVLDATQYPFVIDSKDLNLRQSIIRDADLMQIYESNWVHQITLGIAQELNMSFFDFVGVQDGFLNSVEFNTEWGKKLKDEKWDEAMRHFNILKKMKDN